MQVLAVSPRTVEWHLRDAHCKAAYHWVLADINRAQPVRLLHQYYTLGE